MTGCRKPVLAAAIAVAALSPVSAQTNNWGGHGPEMCTDNVWTAPCSPGGDPHVYDAMMYRGHKTKMYAPFGGITFEVEGQQFLADDTQAFAIPDDLVDAALKLKMWVVSGR